MKISERLENGCCPACGKQWPFCVCKSSIDKTEIRTHNHNKEQVYKQKKLEFVNGIRAMKQKITDPLLLDDLLTVEKFIQRFNPSEDTKSEVDTIKRLLTARGSFDKNDIRLLTKVYKFFTFYANT